MKKYLTIILLNIQSSMEYKFNFITTLICSLIPFGINSIIWYALGNYSAEAFGYTLKEMVAYYFCIMITALLVNSNVVHAVAGDIQSGGLNKHLLLPYKYTIYQLCNDLPMRIVYIIFGIIPITLLSVILKDFMEFNFSPVNLILYIVMIVIAYGVNFYLYYFIGLVSFYFTRIGSFMGVYGVVVSLLSGRLFPLDIIPGIIRKILLLLPFQFTGYVPVTVLQGRYTGQEFIIVLLSGIFWIVFFRFLCKLMLKKGLKNYTSFGG